MNILKNSLKKHGKSVAKATIFVAILAFIVYSISSEIKSLDFAKTFILIRELPLYSLLSLTLIGLYLFQL